MNRLDKIIIKLDKINNGKYKITDKIITCISRTCSFAAELAQKVFKNI